MSTFDVRHSTVPLMGHDGYARSETLVEAFHLADMRRLFPLTPCGSIAYLRELHSLVVSATGGFADEAFTE